MAGVRVDMLKYTSESICIHNLNLFLEIQYPCRRQGNSAFWWSETTYCYCPSSCTSATSSATGWSYVCLRYRKWKGNWLWDRSLESKSMFVGIMIIVFTPTDYSPKLYFTQTAYLC